MPEREWVTGKVVLNIGGVPLDLEMTVPTDPVKPHRMLPVFHQMANSFADIGVSSAELDGRSVSCQSKCAACCLQPIPLAEMEVYQIAELVSAMPEPRRAMVKKRFADAMAHFRTAGWFDSMMANKQRSPDGPSTKELKRAEDLVLEYFAERVDCPFLEDDLCSIYQDRPMACREYLVTSPPANCSNPSAETVRTVELPVKPSRTLKAMAQTGRMQSEGLLLLIQAMELAEKYPEDFPQRTGEQWMADFFGRLTSAKTEAQPPSQAALRKKRKGRVRRKL